MIALKPGMRRVRNLSSARPVRRGDCACAQFCCRGIGNGDSSHRRLRLSKFSPRSGNGAGNLKPRKGNVRLYVQTAMLDQDMSLLDPELSVADNFMSLNPGADDNACRSALARFLFRNEAALQTVATLSGGEKLRAALAAVLGGPRPPQMLVLDEPTNHLDLRAMEALEAALRAYDGALLVVSHDAAFLEAIGVTRSIDLDRAS